MKGALFIVAVAMLVYVTSAIETEHSFEFEDISTPNDTQYWVWRSEASGLKTFRLEDENGVARTTLQLCIRSLNPNRPVNMTINNITYTNDGPKDLVMMYIDGVSFANWTTYEQYGSGFEWNVPKYSGQVGETLSLATGTYDLTIILNTDKYGVEFDRIDVTLDNQHPITELFCGSSLNFVE